MMTITRAEVMKLAKTRATKWLLIVGWCIGVASSVAISVFSPADQLSVAAVMMPLGLIATFIVPLVGIFVVAGDWQSREMVSVLLAEPRRLRVATAKVLVASIAGVTYFTASVVTGLVVGSIAGVARGERLDWISLGTGIQTLSIGAATGLLMGIAFGAATQNASAAIALTFAQSLLVDPALGFLPGDVGSYLQSSAISAWILDGGPPLAALTGVLLWIVAPSVVGVRRFLAGEAA